MMGAQFHVPPCRKFHRQHQQWLPLLHLCRLLPHLQAGMHIPCLEAMSSTGLRNLDLGNS